MEEDPADRLGSHEKDGEEEKVHRSYCKEKGLGKFFTCATGKKQAHKESTKKKKSGSKRPSQDAMFAKDDAHRASIVSTKTDKSTRSARMSVSSLLFLKKKDKFCRECGSRLDNKQTCPSCDGGSMADEESLSKLEGEEVDGENSDSKGLQPRLSVSRQRRARRATLNKYMAVVQKHEGKKRTNTMDADFKRRLNEARKDFQASETTRRLKRAQSLREGFFSGKETAFPNPAALSPKSGSTVFKEFGRIRKSTRSEDPFSLELVEVPEEQEEHYNKDVDQFLAESISALEKSKKALLKSEKQLHTNKIKQIKEIRNNLLSEQDTMISEMWAESKAIIKGLRSHVQELMAMLQHKAKEGDEVDLERQEQIAELDAVAAAFSASGAGLRSSASFGEKRVDGEDFEEVFKRERLRRERANQVLQQNFEKKLEELQEELAVTEGHLNELELEQYFPKCMQWKVRLNSGDGLFIGMRDLDLEMLDANLVVGRGDELGTVIMEVSDIRAIVGIYQFSINGNTATAKLLRGLLTPTVNRLDLEVSGNWYLKLRFKPGGEEKDLRPKWVKEESRFDLRLTKETAGAGLILLPDRVIRWLTTSLLPSVISSSIMLNLPMRLGSFFQHPQNYVRLKGKVQVKGDIPPRVWCAPLVGPTASAKLARKAMGLRDEEAVLLDLMFRSDLATYAGFHRKAISMARMYKWRLQYASQPTSKLAVMLNLIESNPHVLLQHGQDAGEAVTPNGWALQVLNRVCELAVKPVTLDLQITEVEADVNVKQAMDIFSGMYLESLEHEVEKASGSRAIRAAKKKVEDAKLQAQHLERFLENYIASILSDRVEFDFSFFTMGGTASGILMASLRNFAAQLRLPSTFSWTQLFGEAIVLSKGFNLTIDGHEGPGPGEYTLRAKHRWEDPAESIFPPEMVPDDDAQAIIKNLQLGLFPKMFEPGTITLTADSVKASWFMCSLAEALGAEEDPQASVNDALGSHRRRGSSTAGQGKLEELRRFASSNTGGDGSVEDLLHRSRMILSQLWSRYYKSRNMGVTGDDLVSSDSNASDGGDPSKKMLAEKKKKLLTEHPLLPRILTDERYDFQVDLRDLKLQAIREIGVDQKETVRVTLAPSENTTLKPGESLATFHVRFNLAEIFEPEDM